MGAFLGIFTSLFGAIGSIFTSYQERKKAETQAKVDIIKAQTSIKLAQLGNDAGQIDINKIQASSNSFFAYGPRPAAMWICVIAVAYHFLFLPFANDISVAMGYKLHFTILNIQDILALLGGLLGLGTMRSFDKRNLLDKVAFFATLKSNSSKPLTQAQVDIFNKALDSAVKPDSNSEE